jgi:RNA polymerase sigma factor (sigma-70 family)
LYPTYRKRVTPQQLLGLIYETLGVHLGQPRGLFQVFDPRKYNGKLPLVEHFANLFMHRLRGRVRNAINPARTGRGRPCDVWKFRAQPELSLFQMERPSRWDRELVESVPEALDCLGSQERMVIRLTYWGNLSNRKIAIRLRMDHETVARRHKSALRKMKRYYGAAA